LLGGGQGLPSTLLLLPLVLENSAPNPAAVLWLPAVLEYSAPAPEALF
jgi:hypothetical protein